MINSLLSALLAAVISMASADLLPEWFADDQSSSEFQSVVALWDLDDNGKSFVITSHSLFLACEPGTQVDSQTAQTASCQGFYESNGIRAPPH